MVASAVTPFPDVAASVSCLLARLLLVVPVTGEAASGVAPDPGVIASGVTPADSVVVFCVAPVSGAAASGVAPAASVVVSGVAPVSGAAASGVALVACVASSVAPTSGVTALEKDSPPWRYLKWLSLRPQSHPLGDEHRRLNSTDKFVK